jgi:hypothetical protein
VSNTMVKNGQKVWEAFVALTKGQGTRFGKSYFSVRMIAEKAGVSKPTARKYMMLAREQGFARLWSPDNNRQFFRMEDE